jgi:hypothetical protein
MTVRQATACCSRPIQVKSPIRNMSNGRPRLRFLLNSIVVVGLLTLATAVFAQSTTNTPAAPVVPEPAAPVATSKRFACRTASQGFKGQEQRDQMQLCMAQAHLDCLKQAIDQKIVGPQRKEFVKNCAEQ